jgi:hypothetical protein
MYYDPAKEEAEERRKTIGSLQSGDPRERLRAEIRRKWKVERNESEKKSQLIRIFFYILFTGFVVYIIFFTNLVNNLVSLFLR